MVSVLVSSFSLSLFVFFSSLFTLPCPQCSPLHFVSACSVPRAEVLHACIFVHLLSQLYIMVLSLGI